MAAPQQVPESEEQVDAGFGTVDDKGRLSLSKPARNALGIEPGSTVAYIILNGMMMVVPQDQHLEQLIRAGQQALADAGLTVQDLLRELPAARERVYQQSYSAELRAEIDRQWRELHPAADEAGDE